MKKIFSLFAAILFAGSIFAADPLVLYHETFGDNSSSARAWNDSYSVKSGVEAVYSGITAYSITNAKQGKNTTGHVKSGLNQSSQGVDAVLIIGPLDVADYKTLQVSYYWKAGSIKGTYATSLEYAVSATGDYTEVEGTGDGATTFVERTYSLPEAAQVSTLYLKIIWNTSNTQAIIDEVELTGVEADASIVRTLKSIEVSGMTTAFETVDKFSFDGVCKATYSVTKAGEPQDDEVKEVTPTSVSEPDMTTAGEKEVTVSFTDGEVTKEAKYNITVTEHVLTPGTYDIDLNAAFFGTTAGANIPDEEVSATKKDITVTIGGTGTKPRTDENYTRIYKNGYAEFSVPEGYVITKIIFVEPSEEKQWDGSITSSPSGYDAEEKTWEGESNKVDFAFGLQNRIATATVTFEKYVPAAVATPAFSVPEGSYAEAQSVELSCETEDAKIYYTLDGTVPTAESTEYTAAIVLEERGSYTIKAIAIKGEEQSKVAAATYVINLPYTLAELVAADLTANTVVNVVLKDEVIKDFYMYKNAIAGVIFDVQKDGADVKIYFNNTTTISDWKKGGTLSGTLLNATWTTYNEEWQIKPGTGFKWADLEYTAPSATAIDNTAFEAKTFKTFENGQLVIIKNGIKYNATGAVIR